MGKTVVFNGITMAAAWPDRIASAQALTHFTESGVRYPRVCYGDEDPRWGDVSCHGCGVVRGQFHVPDCEYEKCPKCGGFSADGHSCRFEEIRDSQPLPCERTHPRGLRWLVFLAFLAGVLALLRMAP